MLGLCNLRSELVRERGGGYSAVTTWVPREEASSGSLEFCVPGVSTAYRITPHRGSFDTQVSFSSQMQAVFLVYRYKELSHRYIRVRVQELCERRGGRPNEPDGFCGRKATLNRA